MTTFTLLVVYGGIACLLSILLLMIAEALAHYNRHRITRGILTLIGLPFLCVGLWGMIIGGIWGCCHVWLLLHP